jgi:hypothetical protein
MLNRKWLRVSYAYGFQNSSLSDWLVLRASSDVRRCYCREAAAQLSPPASTRRPLQPHSASMLFRRLSSYREPFRLRSLNLVE